MPMNGGTYQFFIIPFEAPEARDQGSESPACRQSPKKPGKRQHISADRQTSWRSPGFIFGVFFGPKIVLSFGKPLIIYH